MEARYILSPEAVSESLYFDLEDLKEEEETEETDTTEEADVSDGSDISTDTQESE